MRKTERENIGIISFDEKTEKKRKKNGRREKNREGRRERLKKKLFLRESNGDITLPKVLELEPHPPDAVYCMTSFGCGEVLQLLHGVQSEYCRCQST